MMAEIQRERPHLFDAWHDPKLDADIMREMYELREGGKPGSTRNADAQYAAKVFATYAELSRQELTRLGASIGKLDGWAGSQTHDDIKMLTAGKAAWVDATLPKLDMARTFPEVDSADEIVDLLSDMFDTIVTGIPNQVSAKEKGERVNPANLAKSLGKSRVLHFRDPDAALDYRKEFGYGATVSGMFAHLRKASRLAAMMETFGPNPELMFESIVASRLRSIRNDPALCAEEKVAAEKGLFSDAGALRHAFDIASGLNSKPVNITGAKIAGDIRRWRACPSWAACSCPRSAPTT